MAASNGVKAKRRRDVAARMVRRFFGGQTPDLVVLDYRYWQARRCGWDVLDEQWRRVGRMPNGSPVLCEPTETATWRWWTELNYKRRDALVGQINFYLSR